LIPLLYLTRMEHPPEFTLKRQSQGYLDINGSLKADVLGRKKDGRPPILEQSCNCFHDGEDRPKLESIRCYRIFDNRGPPHKLESSLYDTDQMRGSRQPALCRLQSDIDCRSKFRRPLPDTRESSVSETDFRKLGEPSSDDGRHSIWTGRDLRYTIYRVFRMIARDRMTGNMTAKIDLGLSEGNCDSRSPARSEGDPIVVSGRNLEEICAAVSYVILSSKGPFAYSDVDKSRYLKSGNHQQHLKIIYDHLRSASAARRLPPCPNL